MEDNKLFAGYALGLIAAVGSIIAVAAFAGIATVPAPAVLLEHVVLGLMMRASYKSFAGWDPSEWKFTSGRARRLVAPERLHAPTGRAAGAEA